MSAGFPDIRSGLRAEVVPFGLTLIPFPRPPASEFRDRPLVLWRPTRGASPVVRRLRERGDAHARSVGRPVVLWGIALAASSAVAAGVLPAITVTGRGVQQNIQPLGAGRSGIRLGARRAC
jgi:hypothetical protein